MTMTTMMMISLMHHIDSYNFCRKYRVQATIYTVGFLWLSCPSFGNNRALKVKCLFSSFAVRIAACPYAGDNTVNRINYPKATILHISVGDPPPNVLIPSWSIHKSVLPIL